MICVRCGSAEAEDAIYCSNCGGSLVPPSAAQNSTAATIHTARETAGVAKPLMPPAALSSDPYQEDYERAKAAGFTAASRDPSEQPFMSSLFDINFRSFITPKVIKVVYVLIMIVLGLSAIGYIFVAFRISKAFGIVSLIILAPLYFFISLLLWRLVLEIFAVIFRMADDLHAIRIRQDLGTSAVGRVSPEPPTAF